jgi:PAS domain S-box-containing protein
MAGTVTSALLGSANLPSFDSVDDFREGTARYGGSLSDVAEANAVEDPSNDFLNASGSFALSDFPSFGRLLHAMPIPAMLIDRSCSIKFTNHSCHKMGIVSDPDRIPSFLSLPLLDEDAIKIREMVEGIFYDRKPQVAETILKNDIKTIWGRIHLRSIRVHNKRFALLLIEDLTAEKKQLVVAKKQEQRARQARDCLRAARDELEQRVAIRTAELTAANDRLQTEVADRVRAQRELRKAHNLLEKRVGERTRELVITNKSLENQILARRKVEGALRESEEKYRAIVENIEEGYYEIDLVGTFTFVNDSACRIVGWSKEELVGKTYREFVDEACEESLNTLFAQVRTTRKSEKAYQCGLLAKGGARRDVEISVSLIMDSTDQPTGFRGCCRDMTEFRRANEELRKLEKLESLGVLAGGIAHDFNNLLTALQGNIALAGLLTQTDDRVSQLLDEAERACERARTLTGQLLTFSKGGAPIKKTVLVEKLARGCCEFALTGSNVRCEFEFPEELWPVEADEGQLAQVFSNLVINANQAMERGGVIRVSGENVVLDNGNCLPLAAGKYVMVSVADQGCGISADSLGKIFDPYFTTKPSGSGLGLASSYSIVKNHQGVIGVESTLNVGTSFHVYLPASEGKHMEEGCSEEGPVMGQGKILLMDDEEAIRQLAKDALPLLGYEVAVASDGAEAVGLYIRARDSGHPFDAVIMDLTVPGGMGGFEATQMLRQIDPDITAIVSSGYSNDPIMADYREHGFAGIVEKPYSYRDLGNVLNSLLCPQYA